ncbi:MAG: TetR/AcrR family transcriptional regulator [Cumulibacter sp.]
MTSAGRDQKSRRQTGPLTERGAARRAALMVAARRVFEERGYFDTRVADIVAEAKVAQGTFYSYFDSKEAIFEALAQQVVGSMMAAMHPESPQRGAPTERVRAAMGRFVAAYRPNATWIALTEQVGATTNELQRLRLQVRESFVDRMARGIRNQQQSGIADPNIDPLVMADVLGAMVDQTCYLWLHLGRDFDETQLIDHLTLVYVRAVGLIDDIPNAANASHVELSDADERAIGA